ncbi:hypothetical protein ACFW5V_32570 [Streptomyces sp. NPDC058762]|uniref:hypothetical protein n=1 Tax=Streptomyces sp. NPDC058762 TaxID=3346629 RepID=UPI0036C8297A
MNTLLEALADHAEKVIDLGINLGVALLIWHLTNRSRDRGDRQAELAATRAQADAFIVAVADVRAAAALNQQLWERPLERWRIMGLVALTVAGEGTRARIAGGTERQAIAAGVGAAAQIGHRELHANKAALTALRDPMVRVAAAAAPLMHHADEQVRTTVDEVMTALSNIKNTRRLDTALEAFGQAVATATEPAPSRWTRITRRTR